MQQESRHDTNVARDETHDLISADKVEGTSGLQPRPASSSAPSTTS